MCDSSKIQYSFTDEEIDKEEENQAIICDIQWFDLRKTLEEEFPWFEYIPRIGWTPCGQLYVQNVEYILHNLSDYL